MFFYIFKYDFSLRSVFTISKMEPSGSKLHILIFTHREAHLKLSPKCAPFRGYLLGWLLVTSPLHAPLRNGIPMPVSFLQSSVPCLWLPRVCHSWCTAPFTFFWWYFIRLFWPLRSVMRWIVLHHIVLTKKCMLFFQHNPLQHTGTSWLFAFFCTGTAPGVKGPLKVFTKDAWSSQNVCKAFSKSLLYILFLYMNCSPCAQVLKSKVEMALTNQNAISEAKTFQDGRLQYS